MKNEPPNTNPQRPAPHDGQLIKAKTCPKPTQAYTL